jgi:hypothetical protein
MENDKLATFKINSETWQSFQQKAKANKSSASAVLKQFIDDYLSNRVELTNAETAPQLEAIEARLERLVDERFKEIDDRLGKLSAA